MEPRVFFYCNQVNISTSSYDMMFTLSRLALPTTPTAPTPGKALEGIVYDSIQVGMSVNHAKAMLPLIYDQLEAYEKSVGTVQLDPQNRVRYEQFLKKIKESK